ncbi:MAG: alcohol dehydrogenase catalytic domain-containing protein [Actinomycetota bacterium]|nr:alcohol dehydrogenase catalytic domain-containing protein [Actinomycetota bacterium]
MRAVALGAEGRLEVVVKDRPGAGPEDVIVSVERCGICGSDVHLRASGLLPVGAVMGHEFAGTIAEAGAGAPVALHPGRRVSVLPARRCGTCDACRAGKGQLCPAQAFSALGLGVNDGAYAEYVRVPAASCHVLPENMGPEQGALVEPYAVGLHAVARSRAGGGGAAAVGIIGAGPIGLMCLAALRHSGVGGVIVAEPSRSRAAVAEAMGATVVDDARRLGRGAGAPLDVVFDVTGVVSTPALALEAVRPGGQVVLVGTPGPGQAMPMPGLLWVVKEVEVTPSIAYTDQEFAIAVAAVAAGAVDADLLVSDVRPLDAAERCFAELAQPDAPAKLMLAPDA